MTDELLVENLKDAIVKLDGGINLLVSGKQIQAYQKLLGTRDKLLDIRSKVIKENPALASAVSV
jgi:hypothetical protein|tara:strand:- start:13393 stop:13584 length:192 start_codon:yes stop_codon:yes gene_type:complete